MAGNISSRLAGLALSTAVLASLASPSAALTNQEIAMLSGPDREKILIEGAKKEGNVVWYSTMRGEVATKPITEAFRKKYPFIDIKFIQLNSSGIMQRALAERDAGKVTVDVMAASAADSLGPTGVAMAFVSPEAPELPPEASDPDNMYVSLRLAWNITAWNTTLISSADAPKTYEALLDPKYKGKLAWSDSQASGAPRFITHIRAMMGEEKALEFLKKLQTQNMRTVSGNSGAVVGQLLQGEFPIVVGFSGTVVATQKTKGAPVDGTCPDPCMTRASSVALMNKAPNPHAAMLLIDFLLDKEGGQQMLSNVGYIPIHPDVPTIDKLNFIDPRKLGVGQLLLTVPRENEMNAKSTDMYKAMFR
jgi:iron(III) transport system substrate-binding protein